MAITRAQQARQMLQDGNQVLGPLGEDNLQTGFVSGAKRLLTPGNIGRAAAFILSGGSLTAAEIAKEIAKQKVLNEARKKVGEVIGPRIEAKLMQQQNEARGTGGYQSDFSQDSGFMGGSGTAAEMGSFADGGRIGFRIGSDSGKDTSGRDYGASTAAAASVSSSPSRNGGGDDGPTRKSDNQKTPVVVNPIKNLQTHFDNNQKLKDAVALGLITNDEYNVLGGYDAKQTLGMGPIDTGLSSLGYNVVQSIKGDQPFSDIFGDVSRNVKGATNISPELQAKYENIMQMADGGRIGAMEGGIMDLETGRQMYFLGKLVKKATRAVKKVVKSPIGKAALLYAATGGLGNLAAGQSFFGGSFANVFKPTQFLGNVGSIFSKGGLENIMSKARLGKFVTSGGSDLPIFQKNLLGKVLTSPTGLITAASTVAGLLTPQQEEEAQQLADNTGIDIEEARNSILAAARDDYKMDFRARGFKADGGIMRAGYQEGSKEPVAKKTMPLLDMGGKEMDLREDGGFVPIGRMEKADDVPARLSKNEFVFTADAVRNAGDGNVDKGAEVMYNMMKNLESGGDVSEESQGLSGARRMFQTSQRLEEVI
jgi:hypothetical protein